MDQRITLCRVDEVDPDVPVRAEVGGEAYAIYEVDGAIYVTQDACTHGPGSLAEGFVDGHEIECPFHQGKFDIRTGCPTAAPCTIRLKTWKPSVVDGFVTIDPTRPGADDDEKEQTLPVVAIAMGDPAGVGPEMALKAALHAQTLSRCHPVLVGDEAVFRKHALLAGQDVTLTRVDLDAVRAVAEGQIAVIHRDLMPINALRIGETAPQHGLAALESIKVAIDAAIAGAVDAVVACPIDEAAIEQAGIAFEGLTPFVAGSLRLAAEDVFLMLCPDQHRIAHVTLDPSLRTAIDLITPDRIEACITAVRNWLRDSGVEQPRIAVSGINPNAGANGKLGKEEEAILVPALERVRAAGIPVDGPFGAGALLAKNGYDALVVMHHDQGHIAANLMAPRGRAGVVLAAPIPFSFVKLDKSLDGAGQGTVDTGILVKAIELLSAIATQRSAIEAVAAA